MNTTDNKISTLANMMIPLIQNVIISRYFTVAGVVIVLYDTILTIEDEVSGFRAQAFKSHSFFTGSSGMARALRSFEATLLHQPVLDDRSLDSYQLPWVTHNTDAHLRTYTAQVVAGFRPPLSTTVSTSPFCGHRESLSHIYAVVSLSPQHLVGLTK